MKTLIQEQPTHTSTALKASSWNYTIYHSNANTAFGSCGIAALHSFLWKMSQGQNRKKKSNILDIKKVALGESRWPGMMSGKLNLIAISETKKISQFAFFLRFSLGLFHILCHNLTIKALQKVFYFWSVFSSRKTWSGKHSKQLYTPHLTLSLH